MSHIQQNQDSGQKDSYLNLGIMNGWGERPKEYENCVRQKHVLDYRLSKNWSCYTYYSCPLCKIKFSVDSSG